MLSLANGCRRKKWYKTSEISDKAYEKMAKLVRIQENKQYSDSEVKSLCHKTQGTGQK